MKLDYSLSSPEERVAYVNKILEENPDPGEKYLEILADYIVYCMDKEEKKQKKILTENRLATVNKRELSFESLASQFENGEDGIYDLIVESDKNVLFKPKIAITEKDLEEIPELRQVREAIKIWENMLKTASGRDAYIIKQAIIDLRKDQYVIKDGYRKPVQCHSMNHTRFPIALDDKVEVRDDGTCVPSGVSFLSPVVCSAILCNYAGLKNTCDGAFHTDLWAVMFDFDNLLRKTLKDEPVLDLIVQYKIAGCQNIEIQQALERELGVKHSIEYISNLWRKKIPNLLASRAEDEFLDWYYLEVEKGKYKKCNKCGQVKLAHNKYFSYNRTSKDGFYSICKNCRSKKYLDKINQANIK